MLEMLCGYNFSNQLFQELKLWEGGISSLDVTGANKVGKVVGNVPEKRSEKDEGKERKREEGRERRKAGIMSINDIAHSWFALTIPHPFHFYSNLSSCYHCIAFHWMAGLCYMYIAKIHWQHHTCLPAWKQISDPHFAQHGCYQHNLYLAANCQW